MSGSFKKDDFKFIRKIGSGGCSQVWLAKCKKTGRELAIKIINMIDVPEKLWRREIKISSIVSSINHDNLLKYYGTFVSGNDLNIIMEYIPHKDVGQCIGVKFSPKLVAHIVFQVVDVLLHIREKGVMYRDLKPDNIMFAPCEHDKYRVKLCDFSHSVICTTDRRATRTGTPCYVSPEIAQGRYYGVNEANIYALGVICHEMLTTKLPYKEDNTTFEFIHQIKHGEFNLELNGMKENSKKFVNDVLVRRRPKKLELVLEHPFIKEFCEKSRTSKFLPKLDKRLRKRNRNENMFVTPQKKRKIDR